MKDESAFLASPQAPAAGRPTAAAPQAPTTVHLPLFRPGTLVSYQGQTCTVSHVVVSRHDLLVYLHELGQAVDAARVQLPPTRLVLQRQ